MQASKFFMLAFFLPCSKRVDAKTLLDSDEGVGGGMGGGVGEFVSDQRPPPPAAASYWSQSRFFFCVLCILILPRETTDLLILGENLVELEGWG